jgi:hypothetical protein
MKILSQSRIKVEIMSQAKEVTEAMNDLHMLENTATLS